MNLYRPLIDETIKTCTWPSGKKVRCGAFHYVYKNKKYCTNCDTQIEDQDAAT